MHGTYLHSMTVRSAGARACHFTAPQWQPPSCTTFSPVVLMVELAMCVAAKHAILRFEVINSVP